MRIVNIAKDQHLTSLEIRSIKAILEAGLMEGKVNRKTYRLQKVENRFKVIIEENQSNDYGKMIRVKHISFFEVA